ncbi:MAG: RluA family pseudouridine synthase [Oscillospiraceae bacterium]|nr:RluA family pseudouridine synthase [Oscillospiraceae bacterium]
MREMIVSTNDAGQRLDRFLQKAVPLLPGALAQKYIRTKRIKVGGKRVARDYRLVEGDTVQLYVSDEFFESETGEKGRAHTVRPYEGDLGLEICYEDEHVLIVVKPVGMLSHSENNSGEATLADLVKAYLQQSGAWNPAEEQSFVPALCNRLDRNTGGLVIAAKNAEALRAMNALIRERQVDKYYLLAVHGRPEPPEGRLAGYLTKDGKTNRVTISPTETGNAKAAVLEYRTLESKGSCSLVECKLITGRTHQVRVQMAAIGCPLLGDRKYGGRGDDLPHQALWAHRIHFNFDPDTPVLGYLAGRTFLSEVPPWKTLY